ncbi:SAV_6107 family HEPN domain-containing protein [Oryzobacter sp. R7]|uniref:SAV_6107 family HEPN domain-containing protein n=1 Tax=Oryzobacter faecalis TaxID=3388656 RepID=UPI00398D2BE1
MSHASTTLDLLDRSREALAAACSAPAAATRHADASLAALRAGAALVAAGPTTGSTTGPGRRGPRLPGEGPHDLWSLVVGVAPELVEWAQRFAAATERQALVESGTLRVGAREADDLLRDAETFLDLAARRLGVPSASGPHRLVPVRSA